MNFLIRIADVVIAISAIILFAIAAGKGEWGQASAHGVILILICRIFAMVNTINWLMDVIRSRNAS